MHVLVRRFLLAAGLLPKVSWWTVRAATLWHPSVALETESAIFEAVLWLQLWAKRETENGRNGRDNHP